MYSRYSLNKLPFFNGVWYSLWKEKMEFFIEGVDRGIQKVVKEGLFFTTDKVYGVLINKLEKDWTKDDK